MKKLNDFPSDLFLEALDSHVDYVVLRIPNRVNQMHYINKMQYLTLVMKDWIFNDYLYNIDSLREMIEIDKTLYKSKWYSIEDRSKYEVLAIETMLDLYESLYQRFVSGQSKVIWTKEIK